MAVCLWLRCLHQSAAPHGNRRAGGSRGSSRTQSSQSSPSRNDWFRSGTCSLFMQLDPNYPPNRISIRTCLVLWAFRTQIQHPGSVPVLNRTQRCFTNKQSGSRCSAPARRAASPRRLSEGVRFRFLPGLAGNGSVTWSAARSRQQNLRVLVDQLVPLFIVLLFIIRSISNTARAPAADQHTPRPCARTWAQQVPSFFFACFGTDRPG